MISGGRMVDGLSTNNVDLCSNCGIRQKNSLILCLGCSHLDHCGL